MASTKTADGHAGAGALPLLSVNFFDELLTAMAKALMPAILKGASATTFGYMESAANLCGLLSAVVLGRLSDVFGRRRVLLFGLVLSILSSVGFAMAALERADVEFVSSRATTAAGAAAGGFVAWLLSPIVCVAMGRIGTKCSQRFAISKAMIADTVEEGPSRGAALGQLASCIGFGFMAGPMVGGLMATAAADVGRGTVSVMLSAAAMKCVLLVTAAWLLTEVVVVVSSKSTNNAVVDKSSSAATSSMSASSKDATPTSSKDATPTTVIDSNAHVLLTPGIPAALVIHALIYAGFYLFVATFPVYVQQRYELPPEQYGSLLTYVGFVFAFGQLVVAPAALKVFSEPTLLTLSLLSLAGGRLMLAFAPSILYVFAAQIFVCFGGGTAVTLIANFMSERAPGTHTGFVLGSAESLRGLCGVAAPLVSGWLFDTHGSGTPSIAAAAVTLVALLVHLSSATSAPRKKLHLE